MRCLLPLTLLLLAAPVAAQEGSASDDIWFRIEDAKGQLIGFQRESRRAAADLVRIERERRVAFRIVGQPPTEQWVREMREEDPSGRVRSLTIESIINGRRSFSRLTLAGQTLLIEQGRGTRTASRQVPASGLLRFGDSEALLGLGEAGPGANYLEIEAGSLVPTTTRLQAYAADPAVSGQKPALVAARENGPMLIWLVERDGEGQIVRAEQPLLGGGHIFVRSERPIQPAELSRWRSTHGQAIEAPYAIPAAALRGKLRYTFGLRAALPLALPQTPDQQVRPGPGPGQVRLDICDGCGPGLSTAPADLARWRLPTPWLQADAPELVNAAGQARKPDRSESQVMEHLRRLVAKRINVVDAFGHVSAREAWRSRNGDCTEHAALLAALARAAGIPARVASGMAYGADGYFGVEDGFQAHSWVLAYVDGRWQSFDSALERLDAGHVALTIGDGDPGPISAASRISGLLEWQAMSEVKPL